MMDPRYALFIWSSFAVAGLAVVWNVLQPRLTRNALRQRLSESLEARQDEQVGDEGEDA